MVEKKETSAGRTENESWRKDGTEKETRQCEEGVRRQVEEISTRRSERR
jgi:hypothetical protein